MSYILDALRRADSERERDRSASPGLNSQMHATAADVPREPDDEAGGAERAPRPWHKLVAGLTLGLTLGAAVWWWVGGTPASGTAELQAAAPMAPAPVQAPSPAPIAPPATPAAQPPAAVAPTLAAAPAPVLVPMPAVLPEPNKKPPKEGAERKPAPKPAIEPLPPGSAETVKPSASSAKKAAGDPGRARKLSELPEGLRRELPPLNVSGSMYSPQPAARMLVLDGQVVREGDQVRPGLVLESIGLKTATLSFRGERFELSY
jgi:general secretion pathway protein B